MLGPNDSIVELSDERLNEEITAAEARVARITAGGTDEASAISANRLLGQLKFEALCRGFDAEKLSAPPLAAEPANAE